ncbi:transposase [Streptomyces sp. NPDC006285]|uniref:transposase n=1 Tax=Streptomyces sp. NPDC006285 TaxID=3364742 RepID=UPI0036C4A23A
MVHVAIERAQRVHGIPLLGPVVAEHSSQAKAGSGFGKAAFTIDWYNEQAICPRGATSVSWTELRMKQNTPLQAPFAGADCRSCPDRTQCMSSATRPRSVAALPRPLHEIQTQNRLDQQTEQWQRRYAIRARVEATLSQNVRAHGLRRSRYRGLARTHVQPGADWDGLRARFALSGVRGRRRRRPACGKPVPSSRTLPARPSGRRPPRTATPQLVPGEVRGPPVWP